MILVDESDVPGVESKLNGSGYLGGRGVVVVDNGLQGLS